MNPIVAVIEAIAAAFTVARALTKPDGRAAIKALRDAHRARVLATRPRA